MPLVRIGDVSFNIEVEGPPKAPFVMLSNSLGSNYHMWDPQMADLTRQYRVIRYDSRGHGRSHADDGPYSIAGLGRDALAIMDALGVTKTHWVGLSKGGMVGMWLLANAPSRIERAVLANTGAHMGSPDLWNSRIRAALESGLAGLGAATMERWFTRDFRRGSPETVAKILEMFLATPPQGYAACCAAIRDMDQREAIRSISKPVLVIVGSHDPAADPGLGHEIAASIPGAKTVALDAAHLSNIEDPANFTKAVLDFLNGKEISAPIPRKRARRKPAPAKVPAKQAVVVTKAAVAQKPSAKKAALKPKPAKKASAKKTLAKKASAKKPAAKKPAAKAPAKKAAKKSPAKKKSRRR